MRIVFRIESRQCWGDTHAVLLSSIAHEPAAKKPHPTAQSSRSPPLCARGPDLGHHTKKCEWIRTGPRRTRAGQSGKPASRPQWRGDGEGYRPDPNGSYRMTRNAQISSALHTKVKTTTTCKVIKHDVSIRDERAPWEHIHTYRRCYRQTQFN